MMVQQLNKPLSLLPAQHPPSGVSYEVFFLLISTMKLALSASVVALAALVGSVVGETHTVHFDNQ